MWECIIADQAAHGTDYNSGPGSDLAHTGEVAAAHKHHHNVEILEQFGLTKRGADILTCMHRAYMQFKGNSRLYSIAANLEPRDFEIAAIYYGLLARAEIVQSVPMRVRGWPEATIGVKCARCGTHDGDALNFQATHIYLCHSCRTIVSQVAPRTTRQCNMTSLCGGVSTDRGLVVCGDKNNTSRKRRALLKKEAAREAARKKRLGIKIEQPPDADREEGEDEETNADQCDLDGERGDEEDEEITDSSDSDLDRHTDSDDDDPHPVDISGDKEEDTESDDSDCSNATTKSQRIERERRWRAEGVSTALSANSCRKTRLQTQPGLGCVTVCSSKFNSMTVRGPRRPVLQAPCCGQFVRGMADDVSPEGNFECVACAVSRNSPRTMPPICPACGAPINIALECERLDLYKLPKTVTRQLCLTTSAVGDVDNGGISGSEDDEEEDDDSRNAKKRKKNKRTDDTVSADKKKQKKKKKKQQHKKKHVNTTAGTEYDAHTGISRRTPANVFAEAAADFAVLTPNAAAVMIRNRAPITSETTRSYFQCGIDALQDHDIVHGVRVGPRVPVSGLAPSKVLLFDDLNLWTLFPAGICSACSDNPKVRACAWPVTLSEIVDKASIAVEKRAEKKVEDEKKREEERIKFGIQDEYIRFHTARPFSRK
jgi:hypothetical protein